MYLLNGLVERPGSNLFGGKTSRYSFIQGDFMKVLSIFVDESGDFGPYSSHSPYYIVSMVFHNQANDISGNVAKLNEELNNLGLKEHVVHTEPLIRREENYRNMSPNERRAIFTKLFYFTMACEIKYKSFLFYKNEFESQMKFQGRMARELSFFIREYLQDFQQFEKVILYYDNGQHELNSILNTVLATELSAYDIRRVLPKDYKLFQVADLLCTLKLLEEKASNNSLTRSETLIFHNIRSLKKDFLKPIRKKEWI